MKKMPCLFVRKFHGKQEFTMHPELSPGCEWVVRGEGVASIKHDGTACMVRDGVLYKRYDAKKDRKTGEYRTPPEGAIPCDEPDAETGHWPHWVKVDEKASADKHHAAAWARLEQPLDDGTYELCGPHFSANPEKLAEDSFLRHGAKRPTVPALAGPMLFAWLRAYLTCTEVEGLVFAHPDGRFAKIRRKDFGLPWPVGAAAAA